jgi:hypothetical protein
MGWKKLCENWHMALDDEDKQWLTQQMAALGTRMAAQLDRVETRMAERLEAVETSLLTEFHNWASPFEARQRSHAAVLRAMDLEM